MQTPAAHYDTHLGPIYSWMLGDIDAAFARSAAEIDALALPGANPAAATAVDLGAGLGLHTLALARLGFRVTAIDSCPALLDELSSRCAGLPVTALKGDLLNFRSLIGAQPTVILCMGDTLTHLPGEAEVEGLLESISAALPSGGVFAATFRDYATRALEGDGRFIQVRADAQRILTCFLEYAEHIVTVHDVLHERRDDQWRQTVSSYPKLRLAPEWVACRLTDLGFKVSRDAAPGGMTRIAATKD